jgi:hypothetical protein
LYFKASTKKTKISISVTDKNTVKDINGPYFIQGQRNALKLVFNGFDYTKSYDASAKKTIKWVCAKKNTTKCRARLRMHPDGTIVILNSSHNHIQRRLNRGQQIITFDDYMKNYESKPLKVMKKDQMYIVLEEHTLRN